MAHPNGQSVAKVLIKEVIPFHGIPSVIYSDNGSHFVNRTIQQIGKWYNIDLKKPLCLPPTICGHSGETQWYLKE